MVSDRKKTLALSPSMIPCFDDWLCGGGGGGGAAAAADDDDNDDDMMIPDSRTYA